MTTNILVICTHNSARSVLAEAMFNHWAKTLGVDAQAYSAGASPSGRIHPQALAVLRSASVNVQGLSSKNMDQFATADAPAMRVVITVCDSAKAQACPVWPGAPVRAHWSFPDPSEASEHEQPQRFDLTRLAIAYRMLQLVQLPFETLDNTTLQPLVYRIGES